MISLIAFVIFPSLFFNGSKLLSVKPYFKSSGSMGTDFYPVDFSSTNIDVNYIIIKLTLVVFIRELELSLDLLHLFIE
jgi:hypothetical protein